jgi:hypothetical protein
MRATYACSRALTSEAKIDYFGEAGRIRTDLLYRVEVPSRLRFDVVSKFGATLSTLTADGREFSLLDLRAHQLLHGPANACNLARFTHVPVPPTALVQLLRGEAPVLVHSEGAASIAWESGKYVVRIDSTRGAREEIHLAPSPADFSKPFSQQNVRVTYVGVSQLGVELYRAELVGHKPSKMALPRVDPDGIDPPEPPSGPECRAEVPGRVHLEVPDGNQDVILENLEVIQNPPAVAGVFQIEAPSGVVVRSSPCAD